MRLTNIVVTIVQSPNLVHVCLLHRAGTGGRITEGSQSSKATQRTDDRMVRRNTACKCRSHLVCSWLAG